MSSQGEVVKVFSKRMFHTFIEVGVWRGDVTAALLKTFPNARVWAVDPWSMTHNDFEYDGDDLPTKMHDKQRYQCKMGSEDPLTQDQLDTVYEKFLRRVEPFGDRVTVMRMTSAEASLLFKDESVDFAFIDAVHLYEHVKQDIRLWLPKVKRSGVLGGDDFYDGYPGVMKAARELIPKLAVLNRFWYWTKP